MNSRLALIPGYQAAKRKEAAARIALSEANDARRFCGEQLAEAVKAEAADQVGRIFTWPTGRRAKIVGIGSHHSNKALAYPIVAYELSKKDTWGARHTHLYTHIYNFELSIWETGTVDHESGEFKPHAKHEVHKLEKTDAA